MGGLNLFLFCCDGDLILKIHSETFGQSGIAHTDPTNLWEAEPHLKCASRRTPFSQNQWKLFYGNSL